MAGLQKILKIYGEMKIKGEDGIEILWVWDYANNKPRIKCEMSKEEITESEKAKYFNNPGR